MSLRPFDKITKSGRERTKRSVDASSRTRAPLARPDHFSSSIALITIEIVRSLGTVIKTID